MHNEMIKIKFLTIGEIASAISFFNPEQTYNIHAEKDILKMADTNFFENVDFIFLVADIQDEFVSKHILETISFLMNYEVPFIIILPSIKPSSQNITRVLNQITEVSSIIVAEDQENKDLDQFVKSLFTMVQTERIDEYRILGEFFSSTIMLHAIFKAKCTFYLFSNITESYVEVAKRKRLRFWKLLEKANTVWIDFPSLKKNEVFNEKVISFFEENMDEDTYLFTTYDETKDDLDVNVLLCNKPVRMNELIDQAFEKMVEGIEKTISQNTRPQLYYEGSSIAEINSVYQFVKFFDTSFDKCEVYLEFPCDSGRVDAVVLVENNLILIEAKSNIDPKKFKVLNAQASRFEKDRVDYTKPKKEDWLHEYYKDKSLLEYLEKFQLFIREKWEIEKDLEIYGVLLADTEKPLQLNRWGNQGYYDEIKLETIKPYTHKTKLNSVQDSWWHLMAYNHICTMN